MLVGYTVGESYTETAFSIDSEGVRPMPPKEVSVTREKLAAAWDERVRGTKYCTDSMASRAFRALCEEIGL